MHHLIGAMLGFAMFLLLLPGYRTRVGMLSIACFCLITGPFAAAAGLLFLFLEAHKWLTS